VVGQAIADLPAWVASWTQVGLVAVNDANGDGILQLAELTLQADAIVLATPEIAGLPYVIAGLVAAGGLAAALSTADGLLLTISNALSHDVYYKMVNPEASTTKRLTIARILLVLVAICAAAVAAQRPAGILALVAWAFSIAGAAFFPALVLGIFWKRANKTGAVAGMIVGFALTLFYLVGVQFMGMEKWFNINTVSAGIFGIPAGFLVIWIVSLMTKAPSQDVQDMVEDIRYPHIKHA
jgi:cation/acetate symporter